MALLAALAICHLGGGPARAAVTIGGPFTLDASDGRTVTEQTFRGKWLLVYFGYTFCPDTCPTVLGEIARALQQLGPDAAKIQPLFITVDPRRDTPRVLAEYVGNFDPRIVGLTGSPEQIAMVAQGYGAYYKPHRATNGDQLRTIDHGSYVYLMGPAGEFVRGFDAGTAGEHFADALREVVAR